MPARSQQQREWAFSQMGEEWAREHHFDNKGKLPHTVARKDGANVAAIEEDAKHELLGFWLTYPDLRAECTKKYGYDPVDQELSYWQEGLAEPEHANIRASVEANGGVMTLIDAKRWEKEELAHAKLAKSGVPAWAHYRPADSQGKSCLTCDFFTAGRCEMFDNTPVDGGYVCDRWEGRIEKLDHDPLYVQEEKHSKDPPARLRETLREFGEAIEPTMKATPGKLFLISHAKTRYNRPGQPHDIVQGWRDIPLDAQGRVQARKLGAFLKQAGVETIYASSLKRATQTAQIAGRVAGVKVQADDSYRPWNLGSFAGHSSADVIPKLKPFMDAPDKPVAGGESFNAYQKRFIPALEKLLKLVDQGHTVALITHSRNLELAEGWLGGHGYRSKIDTRAIEADAIDPATVVEIGFKGGKLKFGKTFTVQKAQAHPIELNLRVHGMSRTPDGGYSYRMMTRDGHYIGRTSPTSHRARKGETLTVQANDFFQNADRNVQWTNPNVVGHYADTPHSWKEVEALAGGDILGKDFADGPAGDAPAANDVGNAAAGLAGQGEAGALAASEGPTISDVHVNVPLKNISVMYANRKLRYQVQKADRQRQLIYGVVLEPNALDSQDDWMIPQEVEAAAHKYLKNVARGKASVAKLGHTRPGFFKNSKPSLVPVESFIAPNDFSYDGKEMVKKGTWVMVLHCEDPNVWADVMDGKYTGLSIGGTGIRRDAPIPESDNGYLRQEPADWMVGR